MIHNSHLSKALYFSLAVFSLLSTQVAQAQESVCGSGGRQIVANPEAYTDKKENQIAFMLQYRSDFKGTACYYKDSNTVTYSNIHFVLDKSFCWRQAPVDSLRRMSYRRPYNPCPGMAESGRVYHLAGTQFEPKVEEVKDASGNKTKKVVSVQRFSGTRDEAGRSASSFCLIMDMRQQSIGYQESVLPVGYDFPEGQDTMKIKNVYAIRFNFMPHKEDKRDYILKTDGPYSDDNVYSNKLTLGLSSHYLATRYENNEPNDPNPFVTLGRYSFVHTVTCKLPNSVNK